MNDDRRVAIVDYGAANRTSVLLAFERIGARAVLVSDAASIEGADAVVLPGVANVGYIAREIDRLDLRRALRGAIDADVPVLGICAGFQLLFESTEEAPDVRGLAVFEGRIAALRGPQRQHVGWTRVMPLHRDEIVGEDWAYFTHGFAQLDRPEAWLASSTFGARSFCAAQRKGSTIGVQFHPERSGRYGTDILRAFLNVRVQHAC